jgi:hypothetical protein
MFFVGIVFIVFLAVFIFKYKDSYTLSHSAHRPHLKTAPGLPLPTDCSSAAATELHCRDVNSGNMGSDKMRPAACSVTSLELTRR